MGQYWTLSIKGFSVLEGKNSFDGAMLQLFRREDALIQQFPSGHYRSEEYRVYEYSCTVAELRERLDLMGFTLARTVQDFDRGRDKERQSSIDMDSPEIPQSDYIQFLNRYSFSDWLKAIGAQIRRGENLYVDSPYPHVGSVDEFIGNFAQREAWLGFFASDARFVLRACLEAASPRNKVTLDLSHIINGGYIDDDPNLYEVFTDAALEYARTSPVVILTEGSTDHWVLENTLPLVYPHLVGFWLSAKAADSCVGGRFSRRHGAPAGGSG